MSAAHALRTDAAPAEATDAPVPFMDLGWQWREIEAEALPDLRRLMADSAYCLGPWVERFEADFAAATGLKHAIGVNSGTSALHLAAIAAGLGAGDEVLVPANTFIATLWPVLYEGATPVLCDVDPATWTIDLADAESRITPRTRAIVPVHLYGQFADMAGVRQLAAKHALAVIEDAAQAFGADLEGEAPGKPSGLGCFSFYPGKNLGAAGEAGAVVTDDDEAAARMRRLRQHGQGERYVHHEVGYNYRMEGVQGLVLGHKLRRFPAWMTERRRIARRYGELLAGLPLELPTETRGTHAWHLYVVHLADRQGLHEHLTRGGIASGFHYPVPLHRQPCLVDRLPAGARFPHAERNAAECLSLPLFPGMTDGQVERVAGAIRGFFDGAAAAR